MAAKCLEIARKHPNARVCKLIIEVLSNDLSYRSITHMLAELSDHPELASDFGISLSYLIEELQKLTNRDTALSDCGVALFSVTKIYSRRVDANYDEAYNMGTRLALDDKSNADKANVPEQEEAAAVDAPQPPPPARKGRKRAVEKILRDDMELIPKKIRRLNENKRFSEVVNAIKSTTTDIDMENYVHPAVWRHSRIVDFDNPEEIDSKRNYRLFTSQIEHRYNTLVPDVNFRLHFKVKELIEDNNEEEDCDNSLSTWPHLNNECLQKYLRLEECVFTRETRAHASKNTDNETSDQSGNTIDANISRNQDAVVNTTHETEMSVCLSPIVTESVVRADSTLETTATDSGLDVSLTDILNESTKTQEGSIAEKTNSADSSNATQNVSNILEGSASGETLNATQNVSNILEGSASGESPNATQNVSTTLVENSSIGDSLLKQSQNLTQQDSGIGESLISNSTIQNSSQASANKETVNLGEIRVHLPHLDDEGILLSDLDENEQRRLSPKVVATDIFPCIPNKENITIIIDKEIRMLHNLPDEDPPPLETYQLPTSRNCTVAYPIKINFLKLPEKHLRRRLLFKLPRDFDIILKARMYKRNRGEVPARRKFKFFQGIFDDSFSKMADVQRTRTGVMLPTDEGVNEEFYGFTESERNLPKINFGIQEKSRLRISQDSGADLNEPLDMDERENNFESAELEMVQCRINFRKPVPDLVSTPNVDQLLSGSKSKDCNKDWDNLKGVFPTMSDDNEEFYGFEEREASKNRALTADINRKETADASQILETEETAALSNNHNIPAEINANQSHELHGRIDGIISKELNDANGILQTGHAMDWTSSSNPAIEEYYVNNEGMSELRRSSSDEDEVDEITKKAQEWHAYLRPILANSRERHYFNIFDLGTQVLNEVQNGQDWSCTFGDVMSSQDPTHMTRYLLSTLMLATQGNIRIENQNEDRTKPTEWENINLKLMSTKRHEVSFEDNIGMCAKPSGTKTTTKRQKAPPSVVATQCRADEDNADFITDIPPKRQKVENIVNTSSYIIRPLTPIAKSTRKSIEHDSGISSMRSLSPS